jgi:cell wall-associated NlpC family hydrolase
MKVGLLMTSPTSPIGSVEYKYKCLAFIEDSYEQGANIELRGYSYAYEAAIKHNAKKNDSVPPKGAYVFYDCYGTLNGKYQNWGHVGLSIGEGKVIHAWDRVRLDEYLKVET